ncbi:MAG: DNA polymerase III subunit gamma/tau [Syntrophobacteraceae bacterium]
MTYLVLARKWRPQTFEDVVGQPHVTKTLQNAVRSGRIAHAYLFTGARGVGKTSVARILAKTLNCEQHEPSGPCNACSNCREITQGSSIDVLEIDGASNRGIDSIRELRETVRYRPGKSRYKIYIIDEVHMLTTEAFNALLKTLEEPPEHVLFVFATTEPHKIPQTILSRCQRFDFRRIAISELVQHLKKIVSSESASLSEAVLFAVAREADGSMRDGQSLLEQLMAFSGEDLSDDEILDVLGVVDRRSVLRVADALLAGDARTCMEVVGDIYRRGIDIRRFCQQLCDHFRNVLFVALGGHGEGGGLELPGEEVEILRKQAHATSPDNLYLYFQMILKGEEEIRRSTLPRISLEMLLLRLSQLPKLESLDQALETLKAVERRLASGGVLALPVRGSEGREDAGNNEPQRKPVIAAEKPNEDGLWQADAAIAEVAVLEIGESEGEPLSSPVESRPASSTEDPGELGSSGKLPFDAGHWPAFLQWLGGPHPRLAAKLSQSRLLSVSDTAAELEVMELFVERFKDPQVLSKLKDAGARYFGRDVSWKIGALSTAREEVESARKPDHPKVNTRRLVMENPIVQQALEILGGELMDIKKIKKGRKESG